MTSPAIAGVLSDYIAEAERLRVENQRLREIVTEILVWIVEREDLAAFMHVEIDRRWPEPETKAA